jgi:glycosyltransferase involved in cell wall biosynthesis
MNVDVVITLFNGKKWIIETLDSVFNQSLKPEKVIVVDDGSSDGGMDIVARYAEVILLQNQGKGCTTARNFGFRHTTAPFVAFLDHDDIWHPDHLRILRNALIDHPACVYAVAGHTDFIDPVATHFNPLLLESPGSAGGGMINEVAPARAGTPWNFKEVAGGRVIEGASGTAKRYSMNIIRKLSRRRGATPNSVKFGWKVGIPSVRENDPWELYPKYGFAATPGTTLFRRESVCAAGGWDPRHEGMEDHSIWLRAAIAGPVAWCNGKTVAYRKHATSQWHKLCRAPEQYFALILKVYDDLLQSFLGSSASRERKTAVQRRNMYIHDIVTAVTALHVKKEEVLVSALNHLNEGLAGESPLYVNAMIHTLLKILEISCTGREQADFESCYLALFAAYPGGIRGPKKILGYALNNFQMSLFFYFRYYACRPWELTRMYSLTTKMFSGLWHENRII